MSSNSDALSSSMNVANFVSVKPCLVGGERNDFKIWAEQMLCLLESQDMEGLVNGDMVEPPTREASEQQYKEWRRRDRLVKGWILGSIGKDALAVVWEEPTARAAWQQLHRIFENESSQDQVQDQSGIQESGIGEYSAVYKAAQAGDWDAAMNFFNGNTDALSTTIITPNSETALHVAVLAGRATIDFVIRAVNTASEEALALQDSMGRTALHNAAIVGNKTAAQALVRRNRELLYIMCHDNRLAAHEAAKHCQRKTLMYLMAMSEYEQNAERSYTVFEDRYCRHLLTEIIASQYVDIALSLVLKYPKLAIELEDGRGTSDLTTLIRATYTLFRSRDTLTWWQNFIYHRIPIRRWWEFETDLHPSVAPDVENFSSDGATRSSVQKIFGGLKMMEAMIWKVVEYVVPTVELLKVKKARHEQALQLAHYLCNRVSELPEREALKIFMISIMETAKYGVSEIAEMIIKKQPSIIHYGDPDTGMNVFMMAAKYRFENVFNLIYKMSDHEYMLFDSTDNDGNNLMHVCGRIAPPNRLNLVVGAARQMQREIQWFKEAEKFVNPSGRTWMNHHGKTPQMVFTEEHRELRSEGERWMKDTCNACTIAATLIATVMFAAAFTVPGGLETTTGVPLFAGQTAFKIFVVSDTISLFTSIASLLEFLSIVTSRYAEEDFLYLTKKLSLGMLSLFMSVTFMLVAFSATLYLVPYAKASVAWFAIALGAAAWLPVTSLVLLQFPLLIEVVYSAFGPGIFGRRSNRVLY